jgi:NAD+ diphosphatase
VTSIALLQWHSRHEHCPRCGAVTVITRTGWARQCPVDGSTHFPRTDPAVIMLVHDGGDRCLLGRGPSWPAGRFSTLAGFVEPGESLEAAVAREVHEEVGVRVTDVRYVDSQPWPFPASLMLGFNALAVGDLAITLDQDEMAAAGWFSRDEVQRAAAWTDLNALEGWSATEDRPSGSSEEADRTLSAISPRLSISRYLIDEWLAGRMP